MILDPAPQAASGLRIQNVHHERLGRHIPFARQPLCPSRSEPEPRIVLRVSDDNDERTAPLPKALDTTRHEPAANALSLVRRDDRHRPERRAHDRPHSQWAEYDVADDHTIGNRDKGQDGRPSFAKGIDDSAFLFLLESLSIYLANRVDITRLLISYLNHVVLRWSADEQPHEPAGSTVSNPSMG